MAKSVAPRSYYVWQVVGEWHKRRGELSSAREAYRRSLSHNPRNAATFHAWGVLEWRCSHQELATQLFRKGLEVSPFNRYILQSWACMEARSGRSEEAQRLFAELPRRRRRRGPKRPTARRGKPRRCTPRPRATSREARRCIEEGVRVDPRHVPLYHAWGHWEHGREQRAQRVTSISAACGRAATIATRSRCGRRGRCSRSGRGTTSRCAPTCARHSAAISGPSTCDFVWGSLEARAGAIDTARQLFEGAVRLDPTNAGACMPTTTTL